MNDRKVNDSGAKPEKQARRSRMPGFLVLVLILAICIVVAYALSKMMSPRSRDSNAPIATSEQQSSEESIPPSEEQPPGETENPQGVEIDFPLPTREGIEAVNAQIRGLGEIVDSITSYRLAEGRYPPTIEDVIEATGLELPENPYNPDAKMMEVGPGDFYPGGFSYIPFYSRREGPIEGFILLGYADRRDGGTAIAQPADLIWPYIFDPPIEMTIPGVAVAMGDGRELIDISDFGETTGNSEEQL